MRTAASVLYVPSPPKSGEKVAVRPDEGAPLEGSVREMPPQSSPSPAVTFSSHFGGLGDTAWGKRLLSRAGPPKRTSAAAIACTPAMIMSPLPQIVCEFARCLIRQRRCKRFAGEGRVRGFFSHAAFLESPLIRPIGHLLPLRGGEGTLVKLLSALRSMLHAPHPTHEGC
jgi:hypothetical protein